MLTELGFIVTKKGYKVDYTASAKRLKLAKVDYMSDEELRDLPTGSVMIFDVECYSNFFYVAFKSLENNKFVAFEQSPGAQLDVNKLVWMLWNFCIVGFNSRNYDLPMITLALTGADCAKLKEASDFIILTNSYPQQFEKAYGVKVQNYNHVDLIEVAPLQGSLKLYAGRLHCETMQDLPFPPDRQLTEEEAEIVRPYCCNDLANTELLFKGLAPQLSLRNEMSQEYGVDLRSKSDAQIAEAVLNSELQKVLGYYPKRPDIEHNIELMYNVPGFVIFDSPHLNDMLNVIRSTRFYLDGMGSPIMPDELSDLKVKIGKSSYKMGMGGLHSQEHKVAHKASNTVIIADNDVASFYPRIILNQGLYPDHLGPAFLHVYNSIVERRLQAKANGDKTIADSLKITINGSFGKLGNKWSALYAPQLMLQVTITGQLVLLMLIERLEAAGIECISGNTDGVVSKYAKDRHEEVREIIAKWEQDTNFETEETKYAAVYSRDVNNYIALKTSDGDESATFFDERLACKTKGTFCERGSALNSILSKNPEHLVCSDAVLAYLRYGTAVETTIKTCQDIRRFVTVRNVRGGGEKDGKYLGKVVRWYYAKGEAGHIQYIGSKNKVAKTDGAKPLMDLPKELPEDIDYEWYINTASDMLYDCGALKEPETPLLFF